ncbi:MAG: VWA domain-containing protein [Fimbriimonas sp.]|nr:VWA domain-containing protein [Fimbriimonas sp.]
MRFTHPAYLTLLIPVLLGIFYSYRHVHGMARGRKKLAFAVRILLLTLLIAALAGPEARRPNRGICTIFLLDRSDSIGDRDRQGSEQFVKDAMKRLGPDDVSGVIAFGKDAVIDSAPSGSHELGRMLSQVDGSATDLAAAIRLASASFPEGKARRIVVLSDGDETKGDVAEAATVAASDAIAIDHVTLGLVDRAGEASIASLDVPSEIRIDQPFELKVLVDSSVEQSGRIDVDRDGILIKQVPVKLASGRSTIVVADKIPDPGFHRYRATLHAERDLDDRNNVGLGFVSVKGKPRLLVLQEKPEKSPLADALRKNGMTVDVIGRNGIPSKAEDLQVYDALILNDINADDFTPSQMKLFESAVRDSGIGLAMVGGENSFLPGGYYGTPIADALPVDLNIRQRKTFPSIAVAIMIDASGSMGMVEDGVQKIRLAAKSAEETVKLMSPQDRVGVAGSTDGIEFVAPMQQLTDKSAVISQIERLYVGGGGIYIQPSMAMGEEVLDKETTQVRHFLLMSDGNDAELQEGSFEIAARMRAKKITTSVVAIGDGKDVEFLKQLAAIGGGRFYLADKASKLPAVATQDTSLVARSAIEEGAFIPKMVAGQAILKGIDSTGTPPLLAYCLSDTRPLATVAMRTNKDDPLLATWNYGLGTTLAFTSDAQPRWAAKWVGWSGFGAFWSQAIRAVSRRATLNDYQVAVHEEGGQGKVEVKAFDKLGNPLTASNAAIRVAMPNGAFRDVSLEEQAPGSYTGSFDASGLGTYIVTVAEPDPAGGKGMSATGFSIPYPPEYRTYRANRPLLERVSKQTGGRGIAKPEETMRAVPNPGVSITELWPYFLLVAVLLLPFDIAVRRLALPMREAIAKIAALIRHRAPAPIADHATVVGRLHQAKQRAHTESSGEPIAPIIHSTKDAPGSAKTTAQPDSGVSAASKLLDAKRKREG